MKRVAQPFVNGSMEDVEFKMPATPSGFVNTNSKIPFKKRRCVEFLAAGERDSVGQAMSFGVNKDIAVSIDNNRKDVAMTKEIVRLLKVVTTSSNFCLEVHRPIIRKSMPMFDGVINGIWGALSHEIKKTGKPVALLHSNPIFNPFFHFKNHIHDVDPVKRRLSRAGILALFGMANQIQSMASVIQCSTCANGRERNLRN